MISMRYARNLAHGHGLVWFRNGAQAAGADADVARAGIVERRVTAPGATIAVGCAGNGPYFSHRTSIDLLGKSDRHIAHMRAVSTTFFRPGHIKYDPDYSIGKLRPDLVEGLDGYWSRKYGYTQVAPGMRVRNDSTRVDRALLARLGHDL